MNDANTRCSWKGCWQTSSNPATDGWRYLKDWPHVTEGWYCPHHADVLEQVLAEDGPGLFKAG